MVAPSGDVVEDQEDTNTVILARTRFLFVLSRVFVHSCLDAHPDMLARDARSEIAADSCLNSTGGVTVGGGLTLATNPHEGCGPYSESGEEGAQDEGRGGP